MQSCGPPNPLCLDLQEPSLDENTNKDVVALISIWGEETIQKELLLDIGKLSGTRVVYFPAAEKDPSDGPRGDGAG